MGNQNSQSSSRSILSRVYLFHKFVWKHKHISAGAWDIHIFKYIRDPVQNFGLNCHLAAPVLTSSWTHHHDIWSRSLKLASDAIINPVFPEKSTPKIWINWDQGQHPPSSHPLPLRSVKRFASQCLEAVLLPTRPAKSVPNARNYSTTSRRLEAFLALWQDENSILFF